MASTSSPVGPVGVQLAMVLNADGSTPGGGPPLTRRTCRSAAAVRSPAPLPPPAAAIRAACRAPRTRGCRPPGRGRRPRPTRGGHLPARVRQRQHDRAAHGAAHRVRGDRMMVLLADIEPQEDTVIVVHASPSPRSWVEEFANPSLSRERVTCGMQGSPRRCMHIKTPVASRPSHYMTRVGQTSIRICPINPRTLVRTQSSSSAPGIGGRVPHATTNQHQEMNRIRRHSQ